MVWLVIEKAKKLDYYRNIVFIDTFLDMPALYNMSDINIFPVQEMAGKFDIPLALVEAMACGKPVIISDIPILREFANDQNSVIIESGSVGQLSGAILDLCQNI